MIGDGRGIQLFGAGEQTNFAVPAGCHQSCRLGSLGTVF